MSTGFVPKFELTERLACKASIMIEGLSGKGKSGLALMLAFGLAGGFKPEIREDLAAQKEIWKKVFAVDTENKSLNLFVGLLGSWGTPYQRFYSYQLTEDIGYRPSNYLALRKAAIENHGEVFIGDSITHMWNAHGGVLDMVNQYKLDNPSANQYTVWGQPEINEEKLRIVETMRHKDIHCITTVRVKEKHDLVYNEEKKKNEVVSLGEQQIQQGDLKYEPDLVIRMLRAGNQDGTTPMVKVLKSRYAIFKEDEEYEITPDLCEQLRTYLEEGVDVDTILEQQRQDYIIAVKTFLDNNEAARPIWAMLKEDAGHKDTKLNDLPLPVLKSLYMQINN